MARRTSDAGARAARPNGRRGRAILSLIGPTGTALVVKHPPDVELLLSLCPPPFRLRVALVVLGLRQKDLCTLTGLGKEQVCYIINNRHKRGPTVRDVERIAEVLKLGVELLFPNHEPPPVTMFQRGDARTIRNARKGGTVSPPKP